MEMNLPFESELMRPCTSHRAAALPIAVFCAIALIGSLQATLSAAQDTQPPSQFFGQYGDRAPPCYASDALSGFDCERDAAYRLQIAPLPDGGIRVEVKLLSGNGQGCAVDAAGLWQRDHVLVRKLELPACELTVNFIDGKAVLGDPQGRCGQSLCKGKAAFDGVVLRKRDGN